MPLDVYKDWLGIPEGPRPPDHYELLRLVQFDDDIDKINNNYKKLNNHVRKYASGPYSKQSQELLNELAKAMLCLSDPERKREYDESLGREFADETPSLGPQPLDKNLVEDGHLTREQLAEAEMFAEARGLSLRDAIVQMKLVDSTTAARALAKSLRLPYVDLAELVPDDSVLDQIPRATVKRFSLLPLFIDDDAVLVACVDQPPLELEEEIRLRFQLPMRAVLATPLAINQGLAKYYAHGLRDETAVAEVSVSSGAGKRQTATRQPSKPRGPRQAFSKLSKGEQAQRRQIGILVICGATTGSALIDNFLLAPLLFPRGGFPFVLTLFVPLIAIFWVVRVYWK